MISYNLLFVFNLHTDFEAASLFLDFCKLHNDEYSCV